MSFTLSDVIATAGAGDPWDRAEAVANADPSAVTAMGERFAAAADHSRAAVAATRRADPVTAISYLIDGVPGHDAPAAMATTRTALGDGGEHSDQIARVLRAVAAELSTTKTGVQSAITSLDGELRAISAASAQLAGATALDPAGAAAAERVLFDQAVAAVRGHGGRINTLLEDYDGVLAARTGTLSTLGYTASPSDPGPDGGPREPVPTVPGDGQPLRPDEMDRIRREYQVSDDPDGMVSWKPKGLTGWLARKFGGNPDPEDVTASEARLLDDLGPFDLKALSDARDTARSEANARFPSQAPAPRGNDDHNDAFRHAYWNALIEVPR